MPIWHRHSDPLIELSLSSGSAEDQQARNWSVRLEGNHFELKTLDGAWYAREKLLIERTGTRVDAIYLDGVRIWSRDA